MPFDVTDLARVKAWMGETGQGTAIDAQILQCIPAVSRAMEGYELMNRLIEKAERVEVVRCRKKRTRALILRHGPVDLSADFTIKVSATGDWANATPLVTGEDFLVRDTSSIVDFLSPCPGPTHAQITYTAGLASDLSELLQLYPAIVQAATLWVSEIFRRRESLTSTSESMAGGGGVSFTKALQHPPQAVRGLLEAYRWRTSVAA